MHTVYQTIFSASPDATLVVDPEGVVLLANPQTARILGYDPEDLVGKSVEVLVPARLRERHVDARRRFVAAPHARAMGSTSTELWGQHKDGREVPLDIMLGPIELDGRVATLVVVRDATDRIDARAALRQRDKALADAQTMVLVGRLSASVAHDFNNILVAVVTYADLIAKNAESSPRARADALEILRASSHAKRLTRQLLSIGRQPALDPRPTDLNALVLEAEPMLRGFAGSDIELEVCLEPEAPLALVDADGLTSTTLLNLVANARDAMPGGGTIRLVTGSHIELDGRSGLEPGAYSTMAVADTGIGIERDLVARVFEPFFTTKCGHGGTGLGLASARGFVRQSGGEIHVSSEVGKGTTFTVYLPRATIPSAALRPSTPRP